MDVDTTTASINNSKKLTHSWLSRADLGLICERIGTPVFIYSEEQLLKNVNRVKTAAKAVDLDKRVELYVPFFPNSNPHVLQPLKNMGLGILVQLPSEYKILRQFGFDKFIVSPGHVADDEIDFWSEAAYPTFLSSLDEVSHALNTNAPSISVRIDSLTSGKPGIKLSQLNTLSELLSHHKRELECFEVYCGSGNSLAEMVDILEQVFAIYKAHFPNARSINFAGGHGFVYEKWEESEKHFDWGTYFKELRNIADRLQIPEHVKFLFEPARDILADVGALLLSVERKIIKNPEANNIVVTNGSRMLMPSAQLRDRRHNVVFLNAGLEEINTNTIPASMRGRSILRHDYILPGEYMVPDCVSSKDYAVILDVGAYCATQHMEFLSIPPAAEVLIDKEGGMHLISSHGNELDKWRHLLEKKKELQAC